jgi:hypothetical protein
MWANNPTRWNGGPTEYGGNGGPNCWGERIQHNGRSVAGFALDAAGDAAATLSGDQQAWVTSTLTTLNTNIGQTTGTSCAGWQAGNLAATVTCFQGWYNANSGGTLRTDGVLDQDTLTALQATTAAHGVDFPTPYPGAAAATPAAPAPSSPASVPEPPAAPPAEMAHHDKKADEKKAAWTTGGKVALGVASVVAVGGIVFAATRGSHAAPAAAERRRWR